MDRNDLKNYRSEIKFLESKLETYKEQKSIVEDLHAIVLDGMPKAKGKTSYKVEELLDRYNNIVKYFEESLKKQNEIVNQLNKMENKTFRNLLYFRYIKGETLYYIQTHYDEFNYEYTYLCKMNGWALNEFDKLNKDIL